MYTVIYGMDMLIVHIQYLHNMTIQSILMMKNHRRHEGLDVFTSGRPAQSAWLGPERREAPEKRGGSAQDLMVYQKQVPWSSELEGLHPAIFLGGGKNVPPFS